MLRRLKLALAGLAFSAASASAGWDNVFQLTCCDGPPARTSYSAPVAGNCEPQARVSYVQRCYYQPETTYRNESYYVPVKENVKSYYYEPVTSYKYTSYYDPCTGCCQKLATPTTSYVMKERCNSVTRWVEQTRVVPVTSYKSVTMYTPVVTYYYPPVSCPSAFKIPLAPPRVDAQPTPTAPPTVIENGDSIPKQTLPTTPNSIPRSMPPTSSKTSAAYTASRTKAVLRGELVKNDQATPRPGTKVIFVNAQTSVRQEAVTNGFGEFDLQLAAGEWYVYLGQGDGRAVYHKKLSVKSDDVRDMLLVSR
jgi:hypothetical protein